ncbi:MAG TPA: gluconate:H+ symporter [Flavisolibacter sp.]|jgi:gluconate transporter|nr:gluconate:H+ symporter [Flavisolibacter sp.]
MQLLILGAAILLLVILIIKKLNPMLALLLVSVLTGLLLGMPVGKVIASINNGIGSTLGSIVMVLALGAMIGKLAEESGAAQKLVFVLTTWFGIRHIQWAILCTGLLAGIPLFYNAGFVVLIPLVFALAKTTKLPLLYVGLPMVAPLSVTHGFLPPHPGPVALAGILGANIGQLLLYGFLLTVPVSILAGIVYPRLVTKRGDVPEGELTLAAEGEKTLPSTLKSFMVVLAPVFLITTGTIGSYATTGIARSAFQFIEEPTIALLLSLLLTIVLLRTPVATAMVHCIEGVKSIAIIILIIAAGGAFKQILVDSNIGETIKAGTASLHLSPLVLGWLIAALFRVTLGSATVAALTASGLVLPLVTAGVSPELMVLSVGAGSLFCSHVNDTGFWMFKEYFGLTIQQTFRTWTVMESLISLLGLGGVLLLDYFV